MVVLLNLFFDDYGLPSSYAWVFLAIALCIIDIIILAIYANGDDFLPLFTVLTSFALFYALFYPITSINPYNYIPISGTDTQKVNFKRSVVGKTVNLGNIKEIMQECKYNDREYAFQEKIEALGK